MRSVVFPNDAIVTGQLIQWIKQIPAKVQVICEPSGGYDAHWFGRWWCAAENQFGPGQTGSGNLPGGGYFG